LRDLETGEQVDLRVVGAPITCWTEHADRRRVVCVIEKDGQVAGPITASGMNRGVALNRDTRRAGPETLHGENARPSGRRRLRRAAFHANSGQLSKSLDFGLEDPEEPSPKFLARRLTHETS
jgi:hypothetical protein